MQQAIDRLKYTYYAYLSRPSSLRRLYRQIRRRRVTRIVEIGLESPQFAMQMISVAALGRPVADVTYTVIDQFELRPATARPGVSLRLAYRQLAATGARIQLFPGEPRSVLADKANDLLNRDLILISGDQDPTLWGRAWFYLPRMLHPGSIVYQLSSANETSPPVLREVTRAELEVLATATHRRAA